MHIQKLIYINEISEFQPNIEISKNKYLDPAIYIRNIGEDNIGLEI